MFLLNSLPLLGRTITIIGLPLSVRIGIDFLIGGENIGFHFNPRFDENVIVENTFIGSWQQEQRSMAGNEFQWLQASVAKFEFKVSDAGIQVFWNGEELTSCFYHHRVDASSYVGISVKGMEVTEASFEKDDSNLADVETGFEELGLELRGKNVEITGKPMVARIEVNFLGQGEDIAFHFNPRFNTRALVRNTFQNNWQHEERAIEGGGFRWNQWDECTFNFYINDQGYYCTWGDEGVCEFTHRIPIADVRGFGVGGMSIRSITIR